MSSALQDLVVFVGRFHPTLVHLPIGGLVLLGSLELAARLPRFKHAAQNNGLLLGLTVVASILTAFLGWLLSQSGGYDPQMLPWHQWTGFAVTAGCLVAWILRWLGQTRVYQFCLLATLAMLIVASHFGGSITHGRDFLTQFAPRPLRGLLGVKESPAAAAPITRPELAQQRVFADIVQPILQRRCVACHGPEKHKAGLSFENYQTLIKGSKDGPVLVPGKPLDSSLISRMLLPPDDEDHMPPQGKPQPTLVEIATLHWWIDCGAPADKTVADLIPGPEVQRILGAAQASANQ
jgi:hypothetical protein